MAEPLLDEGAEKTRRMKKPKFNVKVRGCPGCPGTDQPLVATVAILALCIVILAIVTVAISLFRSSNADSVIRFAVEASPSRVMPGPGEGTLPMTGMFTLNSKSFTVEYDFFTPPTLSNIQSLLVRGPIPVGQTDGPIAFSLCGNPNLVDVCDVFTEPGRIKGIVRQIEPGGTAVPPQIKNIRDDPTRYYIEVLTASNPTSPGALRAPLYNIVGTEL